jgi:hypothetical protein
VKLNSSKQVLRLVQGVENVDPYFHFRYDIVGRAGFKI